MLYGEKKEVKTRITKVFKRIRKEQSAAARQNFWCCSSCATHAMGQRDDVTDGTPVLFYHRQDAEYFSDSRWGRDELHLRYGLWNGDEEQDTEFGKTICSVLVEEGLKYEWNGSSHQTIKVTGVVS
jgi:hypothetical protein